MNVVSVLRARGSADLPAIPEQEMRARREKVTIIYSPPKKIFVSK